MVEFLFWLDQAEYYFRSGPIDMAAHGDLCMANAIGFASK